nr:hypothetical protein [Mycolicibacterium rhodesiae]
MISPQNLTIAACASCRGCRPRRCSSGWSRDVRS